MALTPEEELELQQLEAEQKDLSSQLESLKVQSAPIEEEYLPDTSMLEAGVRGLAQGVTFDTADEIGAFAESVLTGKPYEKALKESRAEYELAKEEHPIASIAGELAGGVALGGGISAGLKGVSKANKAANILRSAFLPSAGKSSLENIGKAALSGATYSGLTGLGASKKEGLERLEDLPTAALTGAALGGVMGGVVEGVKKGAGALGKKLSTMADKGELPYSIRKIRDLYRSGKAGQGYVTEQSSKQLDEKFKNAAEQVVNLVDTNLTDLRNIKNTILNEVSTPIPQVPKTLSTLKQNMEQKVVEGYPQAEILLKRVNGIIGSLEKQGLSEAGTTSAVQANNIIQQLDDMLYRDNPDMNAKLQEVIANSNNELKTILRFYVDKSQLATALENNPEIAKLYERYSKSFPIKELLKSEALSKQEKEAASELMKTTLQQDEALISGLSKKQIAERRKQLRELGDIKRKKKAKVVDLSTLGAPEGVKGNESDLMDLMKKASLQNPLGEIDAIQHNILNAYHSLGGVHGKGSEADLKKTFKIFDVMRGVAADTGSGMKAEMKYDKAVEYLNKANPKLAEEFKNITQPRILELENKKFLEGAKMGEGPRDVGALRAFISAPSQAAGFAANIGAQIRIPRIGVISAEHINDKLEKKLAENPNNPLYVYFKKATEEALNSKDEVRRASILNTLSHYKSFRELFKDEQYKEEEE